MPRLLPAHRGEKFSVTPFIVILAWVVFSIAAGLFVGLVMNVARSVRMIPPRHWRAASVGGHRTHNRSGVS